MGSGGLTKNRAFDVSGRAVRLSPFTKSDVEVIRFAQPKAVERYSHPLSLRRMMLL